MSSIRRGYYTSQLQNNPNIQNGLNSHSQFYGSQNYDDSGEIEYYTEDDEDQEEIENLFITIRTVLIPQIEQLVSYVLIPMIGSWIFTKLGRTAPVLPTIVNVSFCRICKHPANLSSTRFVRT